MTNPSNSVTGGGISNPVVIQIVPPVAQLSVTNISPSGAIAGGQGFILTVTGNGFLQGSQVTFNLLNVPTTIISSNVLLATIPASAIAIAGNPYVIVTIPGGATSSSLTFTVNNPPPGTGAITPQSVPAGSNALTLNVTGTRFTPNSVVLVNGAARPTTFMNSTLVLATVLPADLTRSAILNITVSNPPPGGGTTGILALTVADYNVSAATSNQTTSAGSEAIYNLTLLAENGTLSQAVDLTASGLPPGASATFSPASVPAGSGSTSVVFSVKTAPRSSGSFMRFAPSRRAIWHFFAGIFFVFGLLSIWFSRHIGRVRPAIPLFPVALVLTILLSLTACGSMVTSPPVQSNTGTPSGTYMIIVAATSGNTRISAQITLTIM